MGSTVSSTSGFDSSRWFKLAACIAAMMAIANLQYAWTLFTTPLMGSMNASLAAVQWAFTAFVIAQTGLVPINGYLVDRFGPRVVVSIAAFLVGVSWVGAGMANSLAELYAAYAVGGIGAGAVYGATVGLAMKWFPDRRGLCVGMVAGSFGFGTALTIVPISRMIESSGYRSAFIMWGLVQGVVVLVAAQFLAMPPPGWLPAGWEEAKLKIQHKVHQSLRDYTPREMLRSGSFYLLYMMMTMVAFGGLMVIAQLKPIGEKYGASSYIVVGGMSALTLALLLDRVLNGFSRPFFGWLSDHMGRYDTMALAFMLGALAMSAFTLMVERPVWFVILSGLAFFTWGEIYSLFPSAIADIFGSKYATTNFGIQYTSKGVASILAGPGAAMLMAASNSWVPVLVVAVACNVLAACLALFWLKPLVVRLVRDQTSQARAGTPNGTPDGKKNEEITASAASR
jgi:MFS transporter, OFA family, oxalate/formate antiporter